MLKLDILPTVSDNPAFVLKAMLKLLFSLIQLPPILKFQFVPFFLNLKLIEKLKILCDHK